MCPSRQVKIQGPFFFQASLIFTQTQIPVSTVSFFDGTKRFALLFVNCYLQIHVSFLCQQLDSAWEQVACGKTPDQQLLTRQAHQFLASYRPAARTLHFSTTTVA